MFGRLNFSHFRSKMDNSGYDARHKRLLQIPAHQMTCFEKSVIHTGIKIYKKLPQNTKNIHKIENCKAEVKQFLLNLPPISMQ